MKLAYPQLTQHLRNSIAPIYLISSDELLLVQEAVDTIRAAATSAGFTERISTKVDSPNDWAQLIYTASHNLSYFLIKK